MDYYIRDRPMIQDRQIIIQCDGYMFENFYSLATVDISNWDVTKITDMTGMFSNETNNK